MKLARIPLLLFATALYAQQPVEVATVVLKSVERKVRLPGEFLPYLKVDLVARVNGFVEKVEVDRGSVVKQGQLLVLLSAPELAAQRAEAEAKAQAIESQRAEAQARLVAAESTFERLKAASATPGAVAGNEVIQAEKAVEAARALVLAQASSAKAAQAAIEALRALESYLKLNAPFDGVVTDRFVHPGALAGPAAGPLLRLEQNTRLRLVVAVPEADEAGIVLGARVAFHVPAFPGESFSGVVVRNAHSVDPKTRSMAVEMDVANADLRLAPGMYPDVEWPVRRPRPSLLVPASSVVTTTERTFVIRVRNGRAEWVIVSRGVALGDSVEVFGPLSAGDEIVRRASDEIREGTPLQVRAAGR
ncbi:MAG: efflux RND transporter periplasmic adaptor subunit [Bryobacteraceae bacterium]|jgi:RND family efflux transporter MFP subunit